MGSFGSTKLVEAAVMRKLMVCQKVMLLESVLSNFGKRQPRRSALVDQ